MYYNCSTWRAPCTIPTSDCYLSHVSQPAMHHPYFFVPVLSGHSRNHPDFVQNPTTTTLPQGRGTKRKTTHGAVVREVLLELTEAKDDSKRPE